jgi:hypothetical protein
MMTVIDGFVVGGLLVITGVSASDLVDSHDHAWRPGDPRLGRDDVERLIDRQHRRHLYV